MHGYAFGYFNRRFIVLHGTLALLDKPNAKGCYRSSIEVSFSREVIKMAWQPKGLFTQILALKLAEEVVWLDEHSLDA